MQLQNPKITNFQELIHISKYSRWLPEKGRREGSLEETFSRYIEAMKRRVDQQRIPQANKDVVQGLLDECLVKMVNLEVMGSMRAVMTAGPALERDNCSGYNCAYENIESTGEEISLEHEKLDGALKIRLADPRCFDELLYVLTCGTGMGFSVERQYVNTLPKVGKKLSRRIYQANNKNFPKVPKDEVSVFYRDQNTIEVKDSKYGWASALRILIVELYNGNFDVQWDTSLVRPAGSVLKTFGGRASGPAPLESLFSFVKSVFTEAEGRQLTSLECHDICCKIAEIVVVGGVRRSALISLSNLSDDRMRSAKVGAWWEQNSQRALANNSAVYTDDVEVGVFMDEWKSLYDSKSGERGIFNRDATKFVSSWNKRRDASKVVGTNPLAT